MPSMLQSETWRAACPCASSSRCPDPLAMGTSRGPQRIAITPAKMGMRNAVISLQVSVASWSVFRLPAVLCQETRASRRDQGFGLQSQSNCKLRSTINLGCCILYYTILYYTILYYTILYYTILYYTILYYTILYYTILYYTILYYTILYYTILYYTILYYTIPYYTIPYHTILYYTTLYYATPYYTILYYILLYDVILQYIVLYTVLYYTILIPSPDLKRSPQ